MKPFKNNKDNIADAVNTQASALNRHARRMDLMATALDELYTGIHNHGVRLDALEARAGGRFEDEELARARAYSAWLKSLERWRGQDTPKTTGPTVTERDRLRAEVGELTLRLKDTEAALVEAERVRVVIQDQSLLNKIDAQDKVIADLRARLAAKVTADYCTASQQVTQVADLERRVEQQTKASDWLYGDRNRLRDEVAALTTKRDGMESALDAQERVIADLRAENETLRNTVAKYMGDHIVLTVRFDES